MMRGADEGELVRWCPGTGREGRLVSQSLGPHLGGQPPPAKSMINGCVGVDLEAFFMSLLWSSWRC